MPDGVTVAAAPTVDLRLLSRLLPGCAVSTPIDGARPLSPLVPRGATGGFEKKRGTTTRTRAVRIIARKSRFSIYPITSSGDRVETTRSKWITAGNTTHCQPGSMDCSMALQSFDGIRGATWIVATCSRQEMRQRDLIATHEYDQDRPYHGAFLRGTICCTPARSSVCSISNVAS